MKKITMNTDGGARSNPGPAGIGVVLASENGEVLHEHRAYIGEQTNNFAEYEALIQGLELVRKTYAKELADISLEVRMDSELVVRQCIGRYKIKEPTLKVQFEKVKKLREGIGAVEFVHVLRGKNSHADKLVNEAIDKALQ